MSLLADLESSSQASLLQLRKATADTYVYTYMYKKVPRLGGITPLVLFYLFIEIDS